MSRRKNCSMVLELLMALIFTTAFLIPTNVHSQAKKEIKWRMQNMFPAGDLCYTLQGKTIVDTLNRKLAGKLNITQYLPGQIVPADQMFDSLTKGVYDAAVLGSSWRIGVTPEAVVAFGLPMGWQNVDQIFEFFYKFGMLKWQRDICAEKNVFYACPLPCSPLPIMSNFAFRKVPDMKGKKIWSIGSTAAYVKNLGGAPTTFPPSEIYMGLKLGTIDGMIYSMAELQTSGYKEVVKYINWPAVIDPNCVEFDISLKSWKALPPDIQKTIEDTLVEIGPSMAKKYIAEDHSGVEAALKVGVQEIQMDASEIPKARQAAVKVWGDFAGRSPRTAKTIQMLKDYLATKGIKLE